MKLMTDNDIKMCATSLPYTHGTLSVVVPMAHMKDIIKQIWKSRGTEPRMGELYEIYKPLVFEDLDK